MPQPEQYRRISERYAQAAELTNGNIPEASGFEAYHAFESIGLHGSDTVANRFLVLIRQN